MKDEKKYLIVPIDGKTKTVEYTSVKKALAAAKSKKTKSKAEAEFKIYKSVTTYEEVKEV